MRNKVGINLTIIEKEYLKIYNTSSGYESMFDITQRLLNDMYSLSKKIQAVESIYEALQKRDELISDYFENGFSSNKKTNNIYSGLKHFFSGKNDTDKGILHFYQNKEIPFFKLELESWLFKLKEHLISNIAESLTENKNTTGQKRPKNKKTDKETNKFEWQGTEESILRLFLLLIKADFIRFENNYIIAAIIRDTFRKYDKVTKEITDFDNKQLNVVRAKITDKTELEKMPLSNKSKDFLKFKKLLDYLRVLLPKE